MGDGDVFGRDDELTAVAEFVRQAAASPAVLLIVGEAGIGKTTLWGEAVARAERSAMRVLCCSPAEAETSLSFAGLSDLLDDVLDDVLPDLPAPQAAALEVALRRLEPEQPPDQLAVRSGFLSALRVLSKRSALVVGVDDVQWLDAPSTLALAFALRRLRDVRVAFVVARRGEATEELPLGLDRAQPELRVERLEVGPLSLGATHGLLRSRLGSSFARPLLRKVHEVAGGNPFYALELGRELLRHGFERTPEEPLPLPSSLQGLVRKRLGRLSAPTREVLLGASAIAHPAIETLEKACGRTSVRAALREAESAGVVERHRALVRFSHPLLASASYAAADPEHRRRMHARLARVVRDSEERARHLAISVEGADEGVAAALEEAARHAADRGAPQTAGELADLALAHTPADDRAGVVRRGLLAGDAHLISGDAHRARALFREALERAAAGAERADTLLRLAELEEDADASVKLCERALAEAGDDPARACRTHLQLSVGHVYWARGGQHGLEYLEHARAAIACAERTDDDVLLVRALTTASEREYISGSRERALELLDRALALEPSVPVPLLRSPRLTLARGRTYQGRLTEARDVLTQLLHEAIERGDEWARLRVLWNLAGLDVDAGNWELALRRAAEGLELAEAAGVHGPYFVYVKARAAAHLGRVEEARTALEQYLALANSTRAEDIFVLTELLLGFLELSLGNVDAAARRLRPLPRRELAHGSRAPTFVWSDTIEALVAAGDLEEAQDLLEQYEELARRYEDAPRELAAAARCRGLLLASQGDLSAALAAFETAVGHHSRTEEPFERARTLLCYGATLRRAKRRADARRILEEALDDFERLSAALWTEKARAELARIGGRRRSTELTETERRIAELVAEGRSNKEVAAALFVTPKTVETKLSRMYAKLGIHSRTELTRRVLDEQRVGIS